MDEDIFEALLRVISNQSRKTIFEVPHGSDNSRLVSAAASLKVLEGRKVNVLSTSRERAEEYGNLSKHLYQAFGFRTQYVGDLLKSNPDPLDESCHILYGSVQDFKKYEEESELGEKPRLPCDWAIFDGMDSLYFDDSTTDELVELPYWSELRQLYLEIWRQL